MNNQLKNKISMKNFSKIAALLMAVAGFVAAVQAGVLVPKIASRATSGATGNRVSTNYATSADGRYIAFDSDATNLVSGINFPPDSTNVYLLDTVSNSIRCLSLANPTTAGNAFSGNPIITPDGRYVVFTSFSSDLVANDTNNRIDVFRADTATGEIKMVSVNFAGTNGGNEESGSTLALNTTIYDMSDDGRFIVFISSATNLTNLPDTNNNPDVFRRDMFGNATQLISRSASGAAAANGSSINGNISGDGRIVSFDSNANDLVAGMTDTNTSFDVFVRNMQTNQTKYATFSRITPNQAAFAGGGYSVLSKNGSRIAYVSSSPFLALPAPSVTNNSDREINIIRRKKTKLPARRKKKMKNTLYIPAIFAALCGFGALYSTTETPVKAQAVLRCAVSDPSGSPLNIRSTPNGKKIVGKLKNGTRVAFDTESGDGQDRSWAYVRLDKKNSKPLGWVLREYLECD